MNIRILLLLLSLISLIGCTSHHEIDNEYMSTGEIEYCRDIKTLATISPGNGTARITHIPVKQFTLIDSIMCINTGSSENPLTVANTNDWKTQSTSLRIGNGNKELHRNLNLSSCTSFSHHGDSLICTIYDGRGSKFIKLNISQVLDAGTTEIYDIHEDTDLPDDIFWIRNIGDSIIICRNIADMETRQIRTIFNNGTLVKNDMADKLNQFAVPEGEDFNIMSTIPATSPDGRYCVEAPIGLNYFCFYALDGSFGKTICPDSTPMSLSEILSTSRRNRKYTFADVKAYDWGFALLNYDISEMQYQMDEDYLPTLLLFDWGGNAIGKIDSQIKFSKFDIDMPNNKIFILEDDGNLMEYPLPAF